MVDSDDLPVALGLQLEQGETYGVESELEDPGLSNPDVARALREGFVDGYQADFTAGDPAAVATCVASLYSSSTVAHQRFAAEAELDERGYRLGEYTVTETSTDGSVGDESIGYVLTPDNTSNAAWYYISWRSGNVWASCGAASVTEQHAQDLASQLARLQQTKIERTLG